MPSTTSENWKAVSLLLNTDNDCDAESLACEYLKKQGYKMVRGGMWQPKLGVETVQDMTAHEYTCLVYLIQEWDYGGLTTEYDKARANA